MKKIIIILFSAVFIILSCEDNIFDLKPLDKLSDADIWDDPVMLDTYLRDVYSRMPFNNRFGAEGLETKTDIVTTKGGNITSGLALGSMSRTGDLIAFWNYALIRDINVFIQKISTSSVIQSRKNQLEGEARVLRAMIYFEKQRRYGGVPLVDIPLDPFQPIDQKYTKRSTEEEIADFIDAELTSAIALLSEDNISFGRFNKWSAHALKARANLWSASIAKYGNVQLNGLVGIPSGRAAEFFTKASASANAVLLSGRYSLYNQHSDKSENYRQLFLTKNNGEAIFSKVYDGANIFHEWNLMNLPRSISGGRGASDSPLYDYILACENIDGSSDQPLIGPDHLYDNAFQAFINKDPRVRANVIFDGDVHAGYVIRSYDGIDPGPVPNPNAILRQWGEEYMGIPQIAKDSRLAVPFGEYTSTGLYVRKFIADEAFLHTSATPWMEFRLAEMYLIRAEAEYELGNLQAAAVALNATRVRAGISSVDQNTITLNHVRTERMSELAWELHRWWDLRRWRIAEDVLNLFVGKGLQSILHYETGGMYYLLRNAEPITRIFRPEHYYNPITDSRINNNVDLIENPGY